MRIRKVENRDGMQGCGSAVVKVSEYLRGGFPVWISECAVTQRSLHERSLQYHNLGKKYVVPRTWSSSLVHTLL